MIYDKKNQPFVVSLNFGIFKYLKTEKQITFRDNLINNSIFLLYQFLLIHNFFKF